MEYGRKARANHRVDYVHVQSVLTVSGHEFHGMTR